MLVLSIVMMTSARAEEEALIEVMPATTTPSQSATAHPNHPHFLNALSPRQIQLNDTEQALFEADRKEYKEEVREMRKENHSTMHALRKKFDEDMHALLKQSFREGWPREKLEQEQAKLQKEFYKESRALHRENRQEMREHASENRPDRADYQVETQVQENAAADEAQDIAPTE